MKFKKSLSVPGICILLSLLAHLAPLVWWRHPILYDWGYFFAQRLVERSNFLHYLRVPLHDPWVAGGMDILANPQSRVFSPLIILDFIFPPYLSMVFTLVLLGALGAYGMYLLFKESGYHRMHWVFAAAAFLFSGWFGQHFAEGHITYGFFQAIPLLWYGLKNIDKVWGFALSIIFAVFCFLEGAIYVVFFSLAWALAGFLFGVLPVKNLYQALKKQGGHYFGIALAGLCISSLKWYPVYIVHGGRAPWLEYAEIPWKNILSLLFNPFHAPFEGTDFSVYRMHEFAVYLGVGLVILAIFSHLPGKKISKKNQPKKWSGPFSQGFVKSMKGLFQSLRTKFFSRLFSFQGRTFLLLLFWVWIGLGLFKPFNPWIVLQQIPLVNHAHIQSRHLIFVVFLLVLLTTKGIQKLKWNRYSAALLFLVLVDLWIGRQYPFIASYKKYPAENFNYSLIKHQQITQTVEDGNKPRHYLTGNGSQSTYDPAHPVTAVRSVNDSDYWGEIELAEGNAVIRPVEYTPGKIVVEILSDGPGKILFNTNWIQGWYARSKGATAYAYPTSDKLLAVEFSSTSARPALVEILYRPRYLPILFGLTGFGIMLALFVWSRHRKRFD